MAYLGVPPQSGFISNAKERYTGITTAYVDLNHSISSLADVIVWVNYVKQDATNLTLTSSTRITLGATLVSADIVEVAYLGKAVSTQAPATGQVTNDMLAGSIANSKLANSSITLNGSAVSLGGSATVGGDNTPYFEAKVGSSQLLTDQGWTKVAYNSELQDSSSAYDHSTNYRFTPQVAGKYFIYAVTGVTSESNTGLQIVYNTIRKNGSEYGHGYFHVSANPVRSISPTVQHIITMNGSSDYVECWVYVHDGGANGSNSPAAMAGVFSRFGGFRLDE